MRFGVPIRKGENAGRAIVEGPGGAEKSRGISRRNLEGRIADGHRFNIHKHKKLRGPAKVGIAFLSLLSYIRYSVRDEFWP
jgi:hypothetical protein